MKLILISLAVAGSLAGFALLSTDTNPAAKQTVKAVTVQPPSQPVAKTVRVVPAPSTAQGYQRAFARIDSKLWGAADGAVSVSLGSVQGQPHTVWLFGDTLSGDNGFVHSTAIVQTGGTFHVSNGGRQLLPNDDRTHIYWMEGAVRTGTHSLTVTARSIVIGHKSVWDFHDGGFSRTARVSVSPAGDLTFQSWTGKQQTPTPDPGPMYSFDGNRHHFGYARHSHPELRLTGGHLVSTSQNWDDALSHHKNADGSFRYPDFQPIFSRGRS